MKRLSASRLIAVLCFAAIALCIASPASAATPEQVNAAIEKAKAYLLAHQAKGNWEDVQTPTDDTNTPEGGQYSGLTALATYALLCTDMHEHDAKIEPAIAFLEKTPPRGMYAAAIRCMVWSRTSLTGATRTAADRDFKYLLGSMHRTAPTSGTFSYTPDPDSLDGRSYDNSVSQFAVLGLWSLYYQGFEISQENWKLIDAAWRAHQFPDGAWCYSNTSDFDRHTASMTAAGVATLFITDHCLDFSLDCQAKPPDARIASGINWLGKNFEWAFDTGHENADSHTEVYTLFGLSRVGAASGYKFLGNVDWYQRSTDYLCKNQQADGSWTAFFNPIAATSMGIMSLAYGRAPVVMNKLQYTGPIDQTKMAPNGLSTADSAWNLRPKDLFNFVNWMGGDLEDRFNFEVVNLQTSSLDDLHDAPILYICGNRAMSFSQKDQVMLRRFVQEGGLILGNADCNSDAFAAGFEQLGKQLFPEYEFRTLPPDHVIFANEKKRSGPEARKIAVRGISNGVRELMLLPQADLSQAFEGRMDKEHPELFRLAEDIIMYAEGGARPQQKGITYIVRNEKGVSVDKKVRVAYLKYDGNWDPEPGGWWRLTALMHNQDKTDTAAKIITLGDNKLLSPPPATKPSPDEMRKTALTRISSEEIEATGGDSDKFDELIKAKTAEVEAEYEAGKKLFDVAHLTGTTTFHLNDEQRQELKGFVNAGGILFIDAAGGSQAFADSAQEELKAIFGSEADQLTDPLPATDPLFAAGPKKIDLFQYRHFAQTKLGLLHAPRLRGITRDGKVVVIFSREDLSAGMVGNRVDGIIGYEPQTATEIVQSILLYAAP